MKKALIVGINHYQGGMLDGCISDANNMREVLSRNTDNSPNFSCKLLVSNSVISKNITITRLKKEISDLLLQEAETVLFYFSGHGLSNEIGSYLVTQDAIKYSEGVSLDDIITMANNSVIPEVILILDSCFSGNLGNLKTFGKRKAVLREGVSILVSSRDTQVSMEVGEKPEGLFTSMIYEALNGGAADILGNVNIARIYHYADQLLSPWEQRPIFKSHVSRMVSLRKCNPKIEIKILRKLTDYFPDKKYCYPLDPSYSSTTSGIKNKKNIGIMADFREYYSQGLLVPIGAQYMYDAANKSKSCKLTLLGEYYWQIVQKNQI